MIKIYVQDEKGHLKPVKVSFWSILKAIILCWLAIWLFLIVIIGVLAFLGVLAPA